ncbi:Aste57867_20025 [Aphanomyces stellatus]|uniref:Aste57867_20025 protein n=1 Tax=Aphanomyces stellatus TaxID=120398 RepID=A0A485LDX0_9STRA|nr:hypothetical protein As57867_019959 [Aphanomyces stellatus]VFT96721.1 Aste57867_20025 [Aphanomyces stellatus]
MVTHRPPKLRRFDANRNLYTSVLSSIDLMTEITAFQGGIFKDMRPVVRIEGYVDWTEYFRFSSMHNVNWSDFTGIGDCLDTWLCFRTVEDVPLLVKHLPWLRENLAMVAIQRKNVPLARAVDISRCHPLVIHAGVQQACRDGCVPLLKHFYAHHKIPWQNVDELCLLRCQSVDVMAYLSDIEASIFSHRTMDRTANYNCLPILKWLHTHRTEGCTTNAMYSASRSGRLEVVQFLHKHRTEGCTTNAMDFSASNGHMEIVRFFHENRTEGCTTNAMNSAAANGHLEVVRWLNANRTEGHNQLIYETVCHVLARRNMTCSQGQWAN